MRKVSLRAQIEEVRYELQMREQVYPRLVRQGRMRQGEAELHIERLRAVLRTLEWLNGLLDERGRAALPEAVRRACGNCDGGGGHGLA